MQSILELDSILAKSLGEVLATKGTKGGNINYDEGNEVHRETRKDKLYIDDGTNETTKFMNLRPSILSSPRLTRPTQRVQCCPKENGPILTTALEIMTPTSTISPRVQILTTPS